MERYDVVIVGGATAGSFFARRIAEAGHSVLVVEAKTEETVGDRYDIFHMVKEDFARFGLPLPEKGHDYAFEFTGGNTYSAFGNYPKPGGASVVGMHLHGYTLRMNRWAEAAGAKIVYGAKFLDLTFDTEGRIAGITYEKGGGVYTVFARLVADCSGIGSAVRRALPANYGMETFTIGPEDMFYVTLCYVKYLHPEDYVAGNRGWTFYKTWEAPEADPEGAILGVGANLSYELGEKAFTQFEETIKLPEYKLKYIERGVTPYRRPPYTFVADGFLVSGDAACLTKPSAGEGITSAMVQLNIAEKVINRLLDKPGYLTKKALWPINKRYVEAQGRAFASQLATVSGAVATNARENDFFFKKDIIFSKASFDAMGRGEELVFSSRDIAIMALKMAGGVLTGKLRPSTISKLLKAMKDGGRIAALYEEYPDTPKGFSAWCERADAEWAMCTSMADALKE